VSLILNHYQKSPIFARGWIFQDSGNPVEHIRTLTEMHVTYERQRRVERMWIERLVDVATLLLALQHTTTI